MSELAAVVGYFFGVIMAFTAVVALALGLFNISATVNGPRHYPHAVIDRTVTAGATAQRHSLAAKKASPAKDVSPVVAGADIKKSKHGEGEYEAHDSGRDECETQHQRE